MEFFSAYPTTIFNGKEIKNITIRLDIIQRAKDAVGVYQYLMIKDGQRPEDIALREYGDPSLYWIILLTNDIVNPFYDWPLSDSRLREFAQEKYENINQAHHHVGTNGDWVNSDVVGAVAVSNIDYESALNEQKRKIKIIKKQYIPVILSEYQTALGA